MNQPFSANEQRDPLPMFTETPTQSSQPLPTFTETPTQSSQPLPTFTEAPTQSSQPLPTFTEVPTQPTFVQVEAPEIVETPEIVTEKINQVFSKSLAGAIMSIFPIASIAAIFVSAKARKEYAELEALAKEHGVSLAGKATAAKILSLVGLIASIALTVYYTIWCIYAVIVFIYSVLVTGVSVLMWLSNILYYGSSIVEFFEYVF